MEDNNANNQRIEELKRALQDEKDKAAAVKAEAKKAKLIELSKKEMARDALKDDKNFKRLRGICDLTTIKWSVDGVFDDFCRVKGYRVTGAGEIVSVSGMTDPESDFSAYLTEIDTEYQLLLMKVASTGAYTKKELKSLYPYERNKKDRQSTMLAMGSKAGRAEHMEALRAKLACSKEDLSFVRELVGYLTDIPPTEEDVYAFAHSLWLVKRGIFNMPRSYEQMLVLYGKQGIGKTYLLPKLFAPLGDIVMHNTDMSQINDSSAIDAYATHLVQIYDEMQNADKTCINALKNVITSKEIHVRLRYDKRKVRKDMLATFFATTNTSIEFLINDSTGMRRFYQVNVSEEYPKNWGKVNKIDFLALIKGIDESRPTGYVTDTKVAAGIARHKDTFRRQDAIDQFLEDYNVADLSNMKEKPKLRKIMPSKIQACFMDYLKQNGIDDDYNTKTKMNRIGPYLKRRGFDNKASNGTRYWLLNEDCLIGQDYEKVKENT